MAIDIGVKEGDAPEAGGIDINQIELISAISDELCRQVPGLTAEPRLFNSIIAAANLIVAEFAKPIVKASDGMGLMAWLASDDVGMSSKYMAWVLSGKAFPQPENYYPRDPDDLGRCIRLVRAVPDLAERVPMMAQHGKEWATVATNWDRWVAMYDDPDDDGTLISEEMEAAYAK